MPVSAKVVCDSKFGNTRLITLEIELHRYILPEFNTHRTLSRNFQSTRAVPTKTLIDQVRNDPAMPVHWGKNQPGMVAEQEIDECNKIGAESQWRMAAITAAHIAESITVLGVHKQVVGRMLEPFMWTKGVVTATEDAYNAFFKLRLHKDAQPEIQSLAKEMKVTIESSVPNVLKEGEWHLPYDKGNLPLDQAIKVSCSCVAQVSYRKLDDSLEKAIKIYDMLNLPENGVYPDDPPHFSPAEHIAQAHGFESIQMSGNFNTKDFVQYRKMLEKGVESKFIEV